MGLCFTSLMDALSGRVFLPAFEAGFFYSQGVQRRGAPLHPKGGAWVKKILLGLILLAGTALVVSAVAGAAGAVLSHTAVK